MIKAAAFVLLLLLNDSSFIKDGRFVIAFCGESWWVQSADIRGECKGWAHSGWETNE